MSAQRNYRADLWQALADWKDAGGSIADVVAAIDAFVQSKIDRTADQPTGWQPIETAPKSRTSVLVHCAERKNTYVAYWRDMAETPAWYHFGGEFMYECPTHWMPVPDPPIDSHTPQTPAGPTK